MFIVVVSDMTRWVIVGDDNMVVSISVILKILFINFLA